MNSSIYRFTLEIQGVTHGVSSVTTDARTGEPIDCYLGCADFISDARPDAGVRAVTCVPCLGSLEIYDLPMHCISSTR